MVGGLEYNMAACASSCGTRELSFVGDFHNLVKGILRLELRAHPRVLLQKLTAGLEMLSFVFTGEQAKNRHSSVRDYVKVSPRGLKQGIAQRARVGFFTRSDKAVPAKEARA